MQPTNTVYFDSSHPICRREIAIYHSKTDGRTIQWVDVPLRESEVLIMDNAGFLDYRMLVAADLPAIDPVMVEIPNPNHPHGVKGVGEISLVPTLAAIASAVAGATGKRLYELPMSPPKVLKALGK